MPVNLQCLQFFSADFNPNFGDEHLLLLAKNCPQLSELFVNVSTLMQLVHDIWV